MSYSLTSKAGEDIVGIFIAGANQFGIDQAEEYHTSVYKVFELLSKNTELGQQRFVINPPVRIYPYRSHLIVYIVNNSQILIIRVRHQREDWYAK